MPTVWTNPDGDCGDPLAWGRIAGGDIDLCHGEVCRLISRNPVHCKVLGQPVSVHLAEEVTWLCQAFLLGTVQSLLMKPTSQGNRCCPTKGLLCCPLGFADPRRGCLP